MGCAAVTATATHSVQQSSAARTPQYPPQAFQAAGGASHHAQQQHQQHNQRPGQAPPQRSAATETMKSAPLVKSLVALHRERCYLEKDGKGCFLLVSCMAGVPGEAVAYFHAAGAREDSLEAPSEAQQVSRQGFDKGNAQQLRLFLCADDSSLKGFTEEDGKHQLVLDLRANSADANSVTVQRSVLKIPEDGDSLQVVKQWVQCGSAVRSLGALYGTMPNPKRLMEGTASSGDADGGDCVICLSKPRDVVILHCRHVCLCTACAKITSSTWSFQCPVCRGRVAAMVGLDEATNQS